MCILKRKGVLARKQPQDIRVEHESGFLKDRQIRPSNSSTMMTTTTNPNRPLGA